MSILKNMVRFTQIDDILNHSIAECSKDDLSDCIKFLAISLAQYRKQFGALPRAGVAKLLTSATIDDETAMVLAEGMLQCAIALAQVKGRIDILNKLKAMDEGFEVDWKGLGLTAAEASPRRHYFQTERFFYHSSVEGDNDGWYFTVRGGMVYGPFPSEAAAKKILAELVAKYRQEGDRGGR